MFGLGRPASASILFFADHHGSHLALPRNGPPASPVGKRLPQAFPSLLRTFRGLSNEDNPDSDHQNIGRQQQDLIRHKVVKPLAIYRVVWSGQSRLQPVHQQDTDSDGVLSPVVVDQGFAVTAGRFYISLEAPPDRKVPSSLQPIMAVV